MMGLCMTKSIGIFSRRKWNVNNNDAMMGSNAQRAELAVHTNDMYTTQFGKSELGMSLSAIYHAKKTKNNMTSYQAGQKPKKKKFKILMMAILICLILGIISSCTKAEPKTLTISTDKTTIDIHETLELTWGYTPSDADIANVTVECSDADIAEVVKDNDVITLQPKAEGEVDITLHSGDITSNAVTITIIDEERIAAEKAEQERLEAEQAEQERIAAEKAEQERLAAEEKAKQAAAQQQAAEQETVNQQTQQTNSQTVYVTPTGKRYHYDNNCNGGTYRPTTLDDALSRGLTPCNKCVS